MSKHIVQADAKGRLTLGIAFAMCYFIIEQIVDGEFSLKKTAVVPEQELCLYKNKKALASVQKGLKEAKNGKLEKNAINLDEFD